MLRELSPSPESPVLVIGAASVDTIGRIEAEMRMGTSNPADIRTSLGGVARNIAENLVLLGHPAVLLTAVGDDHNGEILLNQAAVHGVNVDYVTRSNKYSTGSYLGLINANGELQVALDDMRALREITPAYLRQHETLFRESSLLCIDANLSKETLRTAMSLARKANLPVVADPTSNSLAGKLSRYLNRLFIITPNSREAAILSGLQVTASNQNEALLAANKLVSLGVKIVIVAMAEFGVCYATSETSGHISAIRTAIQDPTGAGDALTASVIFALLNEIPIDDAIRLGVSAASLTLAHPGAVCKDLSLEKLYEHLVI